MQSLKSKGFKNFEENKLNESLKLRGGYGGGRPTLTSVFSASEGGPDAVLDYESASGAKDYARP